MTTVTSHRYLVWWLFGCCGLVFAMVLVGAITRLTGSGLSIAEWKPLMGALPPLHEAEWQRVFDLYKQTPEFRLKNSWMGLGDFKGIFFWEWFHRLLGRVIGLAYALPLLVFACKRMIPRGYGLKLLGILLLGGAQGFMGWYMVKSGLVGNPAVSHFRLAAHLGLALMIYGAMFWCALTLRAVAPAPAPGSVRIHALMAFVLICVTVTWGAFTAGLDAGLIYNDSFPKMGGRWIPSDMWVLSPGWLNIFENHAAVQFTHRWLAMATVAVVLALWVHARARGVGFSVLHATAALVLLQAALGIATLFSVVWLPLAVVHQAGALVLLTLMLAVMRRLSSVP